MNNINHTTKYPDPNDIVESWKDRLYEEIKDLPKEKIGEYLDKKADTALKQVGVIQKEKI